jgi:LPXTG-site transpeptidase (sortase) family protein
LTRVFLVSGILFYLLGSYFPFHAISATTNYQPSDIQIVQIEPSIPQRINIPSAMIDIPIIPGGIVDSSNWILSESEAMYLPTSGKLAEGFNTIIYAHKRPGLFGTLSNVHWGDIINVYDSEGKPYTYKIYSIESIHPSQVGKLKSDKDNTLTLFTCDGIFDQARLLVKAQLTSLEQITGTSSQPSDTTFKSSPYLLSKSYLEQQKLLFARDPFLLTDQLKAVAEKGS